MAMNQSVNFAKFRRVRRVLVALGILIAIPSSLYLLLGIFGLVPVDVFSIRDTSGVRTIGSIAVLGCLLAAIGYWDS